MSLHSSGETDRGVYSVNYDGERPPHKVLSQLTRLRSDDIMCNMWQHTKDVLHGFRDYFV